MERWMVGIFYCPWVLEECWKDGKLELTLVGFKKIMERWIAGMVF
jgi:hypothetical protein